MVLLCMLQYVSREYCCASLSENWKKIYFWFSTEFRNLNSRAIYFRTTVFFFLFFSWTFLARATQQSSSWRRCAHPSCIGFGDMGQPRVVGRHIFCDSLTISKMPFDRFIFKKRDQSFSFWFARQLLIPEMVRAQKTTYLAIWFFSKLFSTYKRSNNTRDWTTGKFLFPTANVKARLSATVSASNSNADYRAPFELFIFRLGKIYK